MMEPSAAQLAARRLGLGRLAYHLFHAPVGRVRRSLAAGGPLEQWRTARGHREMIAAVGGLPALPPVAGTATLELHVLTGRQFWDQTAFCLWTFRRHAGHDITPIIYDDGTLTSDGRAQLSRIFPAAQFVSCDETLARLDQHLPASRFPSLRERWQRYPNLRKLTDPHVGRTGWKLVLDSDLLFFRRPAFLLEWLVAPSRPLHAVDAATSYGYSLPLLRQLAARPIGALVNVGLCGLASEQLDWDRLEHWCRTLIATEGTSYYLEQALVALEVAGQACAVAPAADYVTLPRLPEARECQAVMHHYVAGSKRWYFRENWRTARDRANHA